MIPWILRDSMDSIRDSDDSNATESAVSPLDLLPINDFFNDVYLLDLKFIFFFS
jgi:hypothetical protein